MIHFNNFTQYKDEKRLIIKHFRHPSRNKR